MIFPIIQEVRHAFKATGTGVFFLYRSRHDK